MCVCACVCVCVCVCMQHGFLCLFVSCLALCDKSNVESTNSTHAASGFPKEILKLLSWSADMISVAFPLQMTAHPVDCPRRL